LASVWLRPEGRGAAAQGQGAFGHSHGVPDCRISMQQRVCFDGDSRLLAASLSGDSDDGRWQLQLGALWRHESGLLRTTDGRASYRGDTPGAWAQLGWQATPDWRLAARLEGLQPRQELSGPGAVLVARSAGFINVPSRQRVALAVGFGGLAPLSLWLEAGQERSDAPGEVRSAYALLRALWQAPRWLQGGL
ncbi:MAG: hypothetical protein J0M20_16770, partial [Burkholderiales bacterium]|nr:hypothetical protein [Burkholderiales bacterium]